MQRRTFLRAVTLAAVAIPGRAGAQPAGRIYKVGMLAGGSPSIGALSIEAFRQKMRELGWIEGQNLAIQFGWDEGRFERLPELARNLVRAGVDVIVASGPDRIRAAKAATSTIPIVMGIVHEPVAFGFVSSLSRPGGNITGVAFQDSELTTKRLELLKDVVPRMSRVALLWDPSGGGKPALRAAEKAAELMRLRPIVAEVRNAGSLAQTFDDAKRSHADAIVQLASPLLATHRQTVVDLALKVRLPSGCETRQFVEDGCLMSYGPDFRDMYRRAASYVDRILKGARPADLPVEQATKFELVMNAKTARALGLTIPPALLQRSDHVIE